MAQRAPQQEVTLNMLSQGEPDTLDPNRDSATGGAPVMRQVFEPLLRFDDKLIPQPAAAESYDVSADGKIYTFHLRHDGRWSDGQPVTAQQFEYSWKRILDPDLAAPYAAVVRRRWHRRRRRLQLGQSRRAPTGVGIQALDDFTLEIRLNQPFGALPDLAALWVVAASAAGHRRRRPRRLGAGPVDVHRQRSVHAVRVGASGPHHAWCPTRGTSPTATGPVRR